MRRILPISILAIVLFCGGPGALELQGQADIALVYRLLQDREAILQPADGSGLRTLQPLETLVNNDVITTSPTTTAAVKFTDDGSVLRVQANSQVTISAEEQAGTLVRTVEMEFGEIFASVQSGNEYDFQVSTPSGVAAVKGTEFIVRYDPTTETTTVITLDGVLDFFNNVGTVEVNPDMVATSSSQNELPTLSELQPGQLESSQGILEDPESQAVGVATTIEIPGVDAQGNPTTIVLSIPAAELGTLLGTGGGE